jgi:TPP-dependent pyruvate/acetoin dehydrogenase alpha subunit
VGAVDALARAVRLPDLADRAVGYGMPGVVCDGNDVLAVRRAVAEAADRARGGEGRRSSSA